MYKKEDMIMKKLLCSLFAVALLTGCGTSSNDEKTIRIGASVTPHAEIIESVVPSLEAQGYKVEITQFTDYNTPNKALLEGSLDANYFQHAPYLEEWLKDAGKEGELVNVFSVHFEPLGIYSSKHQDLIVSNGAKIAIPNDATNGGRALKLLEAQGIIDLKDGVGIDATISDIENNPKSVEIVPMQAENCARNLQDVDYAVVNGNNALNANISDKLLINEASESEAAKTYANIIAVQKGHENDEKIQALIQALNSEEVKTFIEKNYGDIVVPLVPSA